MIVLTQEGGIQLFKQIFGISSIGNPRVHLYVSNYTPQHTDTYSVYASIEASVGGYAPIQLSNPTVNWTIAGIGAGAQATYIVISWTFTGAVNVWGYWISDSTNTYSIWAELITTGPYLYGASGGMFSLQLTPWLASNPSVSGIPCS